MRVWDCHSAYRPCLPAYKGITVAKLFSNVTTELWKCILIHVCVNRFGYVQRIYIHICMQLCKCTDKSVNAYDSGRPLMFFYSWLLVLGFYCSRDLEMCVAIYLYASLSMATYVWQKPWQWMRIEANSLRDQWRLFDNREYRIRQRQVCLVQVQPLSSAAQLTSCMSQQ